MSVSGHSFYSIAFCYIVIKIGIYLLKQKNGLTVILVWINMIIGAVKNKKCY